MLCSRNRTRYLIGFTLVTLAISSVARGEYGLSWYTIDAGGHTFSTGGDFELGGTIGQPDTGAMTGGSFELVGGFWPGVNACACLGDMNDDGVKDGLDIQQFVSCVIAGGSCSCADVDEMNGVSIDDIAAFVDDLLADSGCP